MEREIVAECGVGIQAIRENGILKFNFVLKNTGLPNDPVINILNNFVKVLKEDSEYRFRSDYFN